MGAIPQLAIGSTTFNAARYGRQTAEMRRQSVNKEVLLDGFPSGSLYVIAIITSSIMITGYYPY